MSSCTGVAAGNAGEKARHNIPYELRTVFGPRLCVMVAELAAMHGNSQRAVQDLYSFIGIPVSQGPFKTSLTAPIGRLSHTMRPLEKLSVPHR
jgi:hypothetical protein